MAAAEHLQSTPRPVEAIAGFVAFLRDEAFQVGVAEQAAFIRTALALPVRGPAQIKGAWRAIACRNPRQWRQWDELFDRYWLPGRTQGQVKVSGQTRPRRDLRQAIEALQDQFAGDAGSKPGTGSPAGMAPDAVAADEEAFSRAQGGASRADPLHDRSLSQWLPEDLTQLERLAERIAERLRRRLMRRWEADHRGRRLDLRRSLRAGLATGGVLATPAWARRRRQRPRLFILVDVSRSMETHAQLFLRVARAFVGAAQARVFVFHTRLAEVTALLRGDSAAIQEKINAVTAGFGGGTRIATSVADFHRTHAKGQLRRGSLLWVLSDGFDADAPGLLADELRQVRGRGVRIHWFHPLAGRPTSAAMQACDGLIEQMVRLSTLRDLEAAGAVLH